MKKLLHSLKMSAAALVVALGIGAMPLVTVSAAAKDDVCSGVTLAGGTCNGDESQFQPIIKTIIQVLSIIAGVAAVIMIIVGGLRYITSGGDSSKVAGAKTAIIYAIVGLVIVALAQFIIAFVLGKTSQ